MNAPAAAEKRPSIVSNVAGQEKDLRDFTSTNARNALGQDGALALSAAARASFKLRHNQTDQLPPASNAPIKGVPKKVTTSHIYRIAPEPAAGANAASREKGRGRGSS
jgi:hypothetical protein